MGICKQCDGQTSKSSKRKPHEQLVEVGERRKFKGVNSRSFEEQDYQCLSCTAKFTLSTNKNDLPWTLWQG